MGDNSIVENSVMINCKECCCTKGSPFREIESARNAEVKISKTF